MINDKICKACNIRLPDAEFDDEWVFPEVVVIPPLIEVVIVSHSSKLSTEYGHKRRRSLCPETENRKGTPSVYPLLYIDPEVHPENVEVSLKQMQLQKVSLREHHKCTAATRMTYLYTG